MRVIVSHAELAKINLNKKASLLPKIGRHVASSIVNRINKGVLPDNAPLTVAIKKAGAKPLRDRGQLMSSISYKATKDQVIVGTNRQGAATNHFGATITAKKKWLWIPASSKTRTLQRRYGFSAGDVMRGLKADNHSVWIQSKGGSSGVVLAKKGKKGKVFVVFILKKSVVIPPRPFLYIGQNERDEITSLIRRHIGISQ